MIWPQNSHVFGVEKKIKKERKNEVSCDSAERLFPLERLHQKGSMRITPSSPVLMLNITKMVTITYTGESKNENCIDHLQLKDNTRYLFRGDHLNTSSLSFDSYSYLNWGSPFRFLRNNGKEK